MNTDVLAPILVDFLYSKFVTVTVDELLVHVALAVGSLDLFLKKMEGISQRKLDDVWERLRRRDRSQWYALKRAHRDVLKGKYEKAISFFHRWGGTR